MPTPASPPTSTARAGASGSDRAESSYLERLRAAGLEPRIGHDPEAVPEGAEVVVSTAIAEDNPAADPVPPSTVEARE